MHHWFWQNMSRAVHICTGIVQMIFECPLHTCGSQPHRGITSTAFAYAPSIAGLLSCAHLCMLTVERCLQIGLGQKAPSPCLGARLRRASLFKTHWMSLRVSRLQAARLLPTCDWTPTPQHSSNSAANAERGRSNPDAPLLISSSRRDCQQLFFMQIFFEWTASGNA